MARASPKREGSTFFFGVLKMGNTARSIHIDEDTTKWLNWIREKESFIKKDILVAWDCDPDKFDEITFVFKDSSMDGELYTFIVITVESKEYTMQQVHHSVLSMVAIDIMTIHSKHFV
jgi:hypothetical protein